MNHLRTLIKIPVFLLLLSAKAAFAQQITITPTNPSVKLGGTVQFSATVTGLSSTGVSWSVGGSGGGAISSAGLYTAPATMPGQDPVAITAISKVNSAVKSISYVNLLTKGPVISKVAPNPLLVGTIKITITGTGIQSGAQVVDTSNGVPVQMSTLSQTSSSIVATGYQTAATAANFTVVNPGSAPSNSIAIAVKGGFTLTVVNGKGGGAYATGTLVTIVANSPGANQKFLNWTGSTVQNANSATTTLTMPDSDVTVTANYTGVFALTVVNGSGSGNYQSGSTVSVTANAPPAGEFFKTWTGATVANPNSASTTLTMPSSNSTLTASYAAAPVIPYPVSTHPRIWVTTSDLTHLRAWATASNPIYANGMAPLLTQAVNIYQTQFFPSGVANSNYPDPGDTQGYTGYLTEEYGEILAFNSLIDPSTTKRIEYAQYARNLLMYAMNEAALGQSTGAPFRDPMFAVYNRANGSGEDWPLIVDWIYNATDAQGNLILTKSDKSTIRKVFLMWANSCLNASTTGGDHPTPIGVSNDLQLLPGNQPYRMASNNYYLGHARLLTMMALSIDPSDDPPVESSQAPSQLGNTLRSYILNANGAWLYQEYAMMGEAATVAQQYGISGTGQGFGLASGGLPPEGMLYGHSFGFILGQLLALQTAGFNNPAYSGPQIGLINSPVWDRYFKGYISSLTPTAKTDPSQSYLGPVYEFGSFGDVLRLWVTPDVMESFSLQALLEGENGQTTHLSAARWFAVNASEGGENSLFSRITQPWSYGSTESILYYCLLGPGYDANTDPRSTYPTVFVDPAAGRVVAHTDWSATNTMFDYRASWESINHQQGDAGQFELYRNGEWLTKQMSNYDNNLVGMTPTYLNSLSLQNWCASGTPNIGWFQVGELANGGQWNLGASAGDPTTITSSGTGYVYASSDLTNLYNLPDQWTPANGMTDIKQATRSILWLNKDYVVIYDRAASTHSGLFKQFNLSLVTKPVIGSNLATETLSSGQQLYIQTLLPTNAKATTMDGAANLNPVAQLEPTQYVLTIEDPSLPAETRFLHVLQGANKGLAMTTATHLTSSSGSAFDGASFGVAAVFFPVDAPQTFVATTFSVPASVHSVFITGLAPKGTYSVQTVVVGAAIKIVVAPASSGSTCDAAGVLIVND